MTVREELDELHAVTGCAFAIRCETGEHCAWSAEIRVTPAPFREDGPDRSYVVYATGGRTPGEVMRTALGDLRKWLAEMPPVPGNCPYCEQEDQP
jgi:hypothetical protein